MPDLTAHLKREHLTDETIELKLIRFLEIGDLSQRDPASEFLATAPEYRFAIQRRQDGARLGRIHIRITDHPNVVPVLGHMGFAIDEEHRRQGYATRAIRLMTDVPRRLGQATVWVLIEPDNVPSRRAVERAGFELFDETDTHPAAVALGLGPRICCYRTSAATS